MALRASLAVRSSRRLFIRRDVFRHSTALFSSNPPKGPPSESTGGSFDFLEDTALTVEDEPMALKKPVKKKHAPVSKEPSNRSRFLHACTDYDGGPIKQKSVFKKARGIMKQIHLEHMIEAEQKLHIPYFESGDAIQVKYSISTMEGSRQTVLRGMVIGRRNKGYESSFRLLCSIANDPVEFVFPLYSPLIREIKFLRWSYLHRSERRTRKKKLFYLRHLPQSRYAVKPTLDVIPRAKSIVDANRKRYANSLGLTTRQLKQKEFVAKKEKERMDKERQELEKEVREGFASDAKILETELNAATIDGEEPDNVKPKDSEVQDGESSSSDESSDSDSSDSSDSDEEVDTKPEARDDDDKKPQVEDPDSDSSKNKKE